MSGKLVRWTCTTAVVGALLVPGPAQAAPAPGPDGKQSVADLLTDLQRLYRSAEDATETYNATKEQLGKRRKEEQALSRKLAGVRSALHDSRNDAGRLAREQYQGRSEISPYVRLFLAKDPERALDQGHVMLRAQEDRRATVDRLVGREKKADTLATKARAALDKQTQLAARQKKARAAVQKRLKNVEQLLSSLSSDQLAEVGRLESAGTAKAQRSFMASGALSSVGRAPSKAGDAALAYAVRQIGKPYVWGAQGPSSFDCSGLTSQAWLHAGKAIPRTSQEQWARLPHVPLSELRPGDLVLYFPGATHVAIYLGGGKVVQAPRPGAVVKVSPIAGNPLLGAVRPDPGAGSVSRYKAPKLPAGAAAGADTGYGAAGAPGAKG